MKTIQQVGFWSGIGAFSATTGYCLVQLLQLYGVFPSPLDEQLIYGTSLCIVLPFLVEILALHYSTPAPKRFWSHAALLFSVLYAVFVTANYVVQLATVIPMSGKGRLDEVRLLQQTPRSLFWNFDALGYIFMGLATAALVPLFQTSGKEQWLRRVLVANGLVTPLISFVYFYPTFSEKLLLLGSPWVVTAPLSMLLLALHLRRTQPATVAGEVEPPVPVKLRKEKGKEVDTLLVGDTDNLAKVATHLPVQQEPITRRGGPAEESF